MIAVYLAMLETDVDRDKFMITLLRLVPGRMPSEAWLLDFLFMFSQLTV